MKNTMEDTNFQWKQIFFDTDLWQTEKYNYTAQVINKKSGSHYYVYKNVAGDRKIAQGGVSDDMYEAMLKCQDAINTLIKSDREINEYEKLKIRLSIADNNQNELDIFKKETHEYYEKQLKELMERVEIAEANARKPTFDQFVKWASQRNTRIENILPDDKRKIHDFFMGKDYVIETNPECMEEWRRK